MGLGCLMVYAIRCLAIVIPVFLLLIPQGIRAEDRVLVESHGVFSQYDDAAVLAFADSIDESEPEPLEVLPVEPLPGTIFPPDFAPPLFSWQAREKKAASSGLRPGGFLISISSQDRQIALALTDKLSWIPSGKVWRAVQLEASKHDHPFQFSVQALGGWDGRTVTGRTGGSFTISADPVGADIFFLRKPVPFAVGQAHPEMSQWLRADLSSVDGLTRVMSGLPVCGNCHAFSSGGNLLGMDLDVDGDKGGYLLVSADEEVVVKREDFISWNARPVPPPVKYSFGLFTSLSYDGRYAASTIGEASIFIRMDDIAFSQLFFPVTGRVGIYDIAKNRHFDLPGADDSSFVQTCPVFSPDSRTVAFSKAAVNESYVRADLYGLTKKEPIGSSIHDLNKKYPIQYDIWTVPFNNGKGGVPQPLQGASNNGRSNYFPRYSPDGRWIVYVQAPTGLVLQPLSKLMIIPSSGGEARELASNVTAMNSWHSWSPNGRWLVFSGKQRHPVTELFLTHLNDSGEASPAIRLFRLSSSSMAAMVPEFVPASWDAISSISFDFKIDGSKQVRNGNVR